MDYTNYHVEVTPDGQRVHVTARHPDGTEAGQPRGPFCLAPFEDEISALADKVAQDTASRREIERLGELLFRALFCNAAVAEHFRTTLRQARERESGLRLELDFDETRLPEVAALPWELLRAPQTEGYPAVTLSTAPYLVLSRRRSLWEPPRRVAKTDPWRILLAVAAPDDPDLGPLAYEEALQELRTLTRQPEAGFEPLGEPLLDADPLRLDQALGHRPDILHFIGHGRFVPDPADPHGELAIVGAGGWTEWLRDDDFAGLLQRHVPGVVFLQACEGGTLGSVRGLTGVASKVVQHNTPVVVAMQYPISNAGALAFARTFYARLAAGDPVDKAAQEGRRALWYRYIGRREFATPVLFMRAPNGQLFADQAAENQEAARIDLSGSQGAVISPTGPVTQHFGDVINASGGSTVVSRSPGASVSQPTRQTSERLNYSSGLDRMGEIISTQAPELLSEFYTQEARLLDNLQDESRYGSTETVRAERARIVRALNDLASRAGLESSFNDLCRE
jgi:hypothetical protein